MSGIKCTKRLESDVAMQPVRSLAGGINGIHACVQNRYKQADCASPAPRRAAVSIVPQLSGTLIRSH